MRQSFSFKCMAKWDRENKSVCFKLLGFCPFSSPLFQLTTLPWVYMIICIVAYMCGCVRLGHFYYILRLPWNSCKLSRTIIVYGSISLARIQSFRLELLFWNIILEIIYWISLVTLIIFQASLDRMHCVNLLSRWLFESILQLKFHQTPICVANWTLVHILAPTTTTTTTTVDGLVSNEYIHQNEFDI